MKFNEPMDGRISSMRNCFAIPQSLEKSRKDFSKAGSGNVILSCQGILSHGGRVSNMQNCEAILQSQKKSMEGFFLGRHGLGAISLNVSRYA